MPTPCKSSTVPQAPRCFPFCSTPQPTHKTDPVATSPKKLIYFTASFPYGLGETWKSNELKYFVEYFDEITVVPYSYGGNRTSPKTLPAGVKLEGPLFDSDAMTVNAGSFFKLIHRNLPYYMRELISKKAFLSKARTIAWLKASLQIKQ